MPEGLLGLRILLVEDEMLVSLLLQDMLEELGCVVVGPASHLRAALKLAASAAFDAAILDVNLGGEQSYPVADLLRDKGVPFVFSTGYDRLGAGFEASPHLQKPFTLADLARQLAMLLA